MAVTHALNSYNRTMKVFWNIWHQHWTSRTATKTSDVFETFHFFLYWYLQRAQASSRTGQQSHQDSRLAKVCPSDWHVSFVGLDSFWPALGYLYHPYSAAAFGSSNIDFSQVKGVLEKKWLPTNCGLCSTDECRHAALDYCGNFISSFASLRWS
jgi:hypothetical protein